MSVTRKEKTDKKLAFEREHVVGKLVEAMLSDNYIPWTNPVIGGLFPQNPFTRHKFTGGNIFMCAFAMRSNEWSCPFFASKGQLRKQNMWITKEQFKNSTLLCRPRMGPKQTRERERNGKVETFSWTPIIGFEWVDYWNLQQTDADWESMMPKRETEQIDASGVIDFLTSDKRLPEVKWDRTHFASGAAGSYNPRTDIVYMWQRTDYRTDAMCASVLAHEYAHSTGHASRLDRDLRMLIEDRHQYSIEELHAEGASALVMAHFGLETHVINNSQAYVQNWATAIHDNPDLLWDAMSVAQKIADYLLKREGTDVDASED